MNRLRLPIILAFSLTLSFNLVGQTNNTPIITFEELAFNFGDLIQGEKTSHSFNFTNTGTEALVISNVLTTCGCTATKWPRKPISAGKTGQIKITFDSSGRMGKQNKIITVVTNAKIQHIRLSITASVLPGKGNY